MSTDDSQWVLGGLRLLGLTERLGLARHEAIAIGDSPNGILAAKRAGLFCLAVSHAISENLDLGAADLVVGSLVDLPLADLINRAEQSP